MSGNTERCEDMALVDPMPAPTVNHGADWASQFGRYTPRRRAESPTKQREFTLESLAAELSWLSASPTGGFTYLSAGSAGIPGNVYTASTAALSRAASASYERAEGTVTSRVNGTTRPALQKSRSFPRIKRDEPDSESKESGGHSPGPLRKSKSVRFADSQGLPLVEAVHPLTSADPSYTTCKIVPYTDEDIFGLGAVIGRAFASPSDTSPMLPKKKPPPGEPVQPRTPPKPPQPASSARARLFKFKQPGSEPGFLERVAKDNVVLESVRAESRSIHGVIRVNNLCYSKTVIVRWTLDDWRTHHDTQAVFCANDGTTDRFTFELPINGDDLSFCIWFRAHDLGIESWDSHFGQNYLIVSQ